MPSKNEEKIYIKDSYYHIYNRGVEKRIIFQDQEDYSTFLSYLKTYLLSKDEDSLRQIIINPKISSYEKNKAKKLLNLNNFSEELILIAYSLMPNHFHLLIHQAKENTIDKFMNSLGTRYSMYFNRKYNRVGPLFQGIYKAVLVETDEQLLHLSRYIHSQQGLQGHPLEKALPSSYSNYVGKVREEWLKTNKVLAFFHKVNENFDKSLEIRSYKDFVERKLNDKEELMIGSIKLD